jgi:hypothetical protein
MDVHDLPVPGDSTIEAMAKELHSGLEIDLELEFRHSKLAQLHQYWSGLARGQAMPCRNDVDPLTVPRALLSCMALAEVIDRRPRLWRTPVLSLACAGYPYHPHAGTRSDRQNCG